MHRERRAWALDSMERDIQFMLSLFLVIISARRRAHMLRGLVATW
jgi:hypothetical protein